MNLFSDPELDMEEQNKVNLLPFLLQIDCSI